MKKKTWLSPKIPGPQNKRGNTLQSKKKVNNIKTNNKPYLDLPTLSSFKCRVPAARSPLTSGGGVPGPTGWQNVSWLGMVTVNSKNIVLPEGYAAAETASFTSSPYSRSDFRTARARFLHR